MPVMRTLAVAWTLAAVMGAAPVGLTASDATEAVGGRNSVCFPRNRIRRPNAIFAAMPMTKSHDDVWGPTMSTRRRRSGMRPSTRQPPSTHRIAHPNPRVRPLPHEGGDWAS